MPNVALLTAILNDLVTAWDLFDKDGPMPLDEIVERARLATRRDDGDGQTEAREAAKARLRADIPAEELPACLAPDCECRPGRECERDCDADEADRAVFEAMGVSLEPPETPDCQPSNPDECPACRGGRCIGEPT